MSHRKRGTASPETQASSTTLDTSKQVRSPCRRWLWLPVFIIFGSNPLDLYRANTFSHQLNDYCTHLHDPALSFLHYIISTIMFSKSANIPRIVKPRPIDTAPRVLIVVGTIPLSTLFSVVETNKSNEHFKYLCLFRFRVRRRSCRVAPLERGRGTNVGHQEGNARR